MVGIAYPSLPYTPFQLPDVPVSACTNRAVPAAGGGGAGAVVLPLHAASARCTLSRPPDAMRPASPAIRSELFNNSARSAAVSSVHFDRISAAAPETCGVAIDVPVFQP